MVCPVGRKWKAQSVEKADAYTGSTAAGTRKATQLVLWTPNPICIIHIKTSHLGEMAFIFGRASVSWSKGQTKGAR